MNKYRSFLIALLLCVGINSFAASFTTKRLEQIASHLKLLHLDTLTTGENETYKYRSHPLVVRVNQFGEIEHIGLKLFSKEIKSMSSSPIYDFLERYLLDKLSAPTTSEQAFNMRWDHVTFIHGNPTSALSLNGTETFSMRSIGMHHYLVSWERAGRILLEMEFDMDWQLLSGCNAIELEDNFIRDLKRVRKETFLETDIVIPNDIVGTEYVKEGSTAFADVIRNDLYYTRENTVDSDWKLVVDRRRPSQSVPNMLLTPAASDGMRINVQVDRYGYGVDTICVEYSSLLKKCKDEGCDVYYGIKGKVGNIYKGTVFFVNEKGGYLSMLSVEFPEDAFDHPKKSIISGRIWTYVPLHNVSERYLSVHYTKKF